MPAAGDTPFGQARRGDAYWPLPIGVNELGKRLFADKVAAATLPACRATQRVNRVSALRVRSPVTPANGRPARIIVTSPANCRNDFGRFESAKHVVDERKRIRLRTDFCRVPTRRAIREDADTRVSHSAFLRALVHPSFLRDIADSKNRIGCR